MTVRPPTRIVPYPSVRDITASRDFYVEALGLDVASGTIVNVLAHIP